MNTGHIAGGGIGVFIGVIVAAILNKYTGIRLTDTDAALLGSAFLAAGVGLGHGIYTKGLVGIFTSVWRGSKK